MACALTEPTYKLAVFDLDGTSIDAQSGALFAKYLYSQGYLSFRCGLSLLWWGVRYVLHLPHSQNKPREAIFAQLRTLSAEEIESLMRDFYEKEISSKFRQHALEEIQKLKKLGYVVILVSATFDYIAQAAGQYLQVDAVIATEMQKDSEGEYTGSVQGSSVEGREKIRATKAWAQKNLGSDTWRISRAYGDHYTDKELLAYADEAFAVCPGYVLRRIARKHGWAILEWR